MITKKPRLREKLNSSFAIPSVTHTYSVITEYIKKYILSKFSNEYFKTIHVEGKHVFDDFRKFKIDKLLKLEKPILVINPRINLEYTREMLDTHMFGLDMIMRTGILERALIKDYERSAFIGSTMELLDIRYHLTMRVETKAQQIDLYKYLAVAFSIGHTHQDNIDIDYHLPYPLMLQLASDTGYEVKNNEIVDIFGFLRHVNKLSMLPVFFKYRTINSRSEFFMRFYSIDIMIDNTQTLSIDDGERRGMLHDNYNIEMDIGVKTATPKFFLYYSTNRHDLIKQVDTIDPNKTTNIIYPYYTIEIERIPKINEKGWKQYLLTEYYEENIEDPLVIDFSGLFKDGVGIYKVIEYNNSIGVNSNMFIDFKIYNAGKYLIPYTMDWNEVKLTVLDKLEAHTTTIAIYIDTIYSTEKLGELTQMKSTRFE